MKGSPLTEVEIFQVEESSIEWTLDVLRDAGAEGFEAFVLWGGLALDSAFVVSSVLVPEQEGSKTASGLLVTVTGESLFQANQYFFRKGHLLAVQVHSHPTEAFHSGTDDSYPLVTLEGGLSIVVPYFGGNGVADLDDWAFYRLWNSDWIEDPKGSHILEIIG